VSAESRVRRTVVSFVVIVFFTPIFRLQGPCRAVNRLPSGSASTRKHTAQAVPADFPSVVGVYQLCYSRAAFSLHDLAGPHIKQK
jgi:predicted membrane-bound mannosyltransferase